MLSRLLDLVRRPRIPDMSKMDISQREDLLSTTALQADLGKNLDRIREFSGDSSDLNIRPFTAYPGGVACALVFIDGLVDKVVLSSAMDSLAVEPLKARRIPRPRKSYIAQIRENLLVNHEIKETGELEGLFTGLSSGEAALLAEGSSRALLLDARGWERRAVDEPDAETTIRGSREGFVESIRVNTSLVRRRIKSPNLWVERIVVGSLTRTNVEIVYVKGLAGEELLSEIRDRIGRIRIDGVLESGYIEELITDTPYTIFPTVLRTERPDRVAGSLLEGHVAIFTDGTPFALIIPGTLLGFIQAPDDYNEIFPVGTLIRALRILALVMAIFLPGIYVAAVTFHQELLPPPLLLRIAATREGVPFPVAAEMFFMEALFEILREAGIRLPRAIGPAISIVGALVLGQAAIQAGMVSPAVVIVVALTAIASFTTPAFSLAISARLVRFTFILLGAVFGFFGLQFGALLMLIHLCALRSFGVPYLAPYAPFIAGDMKDSLLRWFRWGLITRPRLVGFREPVRQKQEQKPSPGRGQEPGG